MKHPNHKGQSECLIEVIIYKFHPGQLLVQVHCLTKAVLEISAQQRDNKNIYASQGKPFASTEQKLGKLHRKDFLLCMCFKAVYLCTSLCLEDSEVTGECQSEGMLPLVSLFIFKVLFTFMAYVVELKYLQLLFLPTSPIPLSTGSNLPSARLCSA